MDIFKKSIYLSLFLVSSVLAAPLTTGAESGSPSRHDINIDINGLTEKDGSLSEFTQDFCATLEQDCVTIVNHCEESPLPNSCFLRTYLFHAMDFQTCDNDDVTACTIERAHYEDKVANFTDDYASQPGIGRAALNMCFPFFKVTIDQPELRAIKEQIDKVMPGLGDYLDYKGLYQCIQEQFLDMTKKTLTQ